MNFMEEFSEPHEPTATNLLQKRIPGDGDGGRSNGRKQEPEIGWCESDR